MPAGTAATRQGSQPRHRRAPIAGTTERAASEVQLVVRGFSHPGITMPRPHPLNVPSDSSRIPAPYRHVAVAEALAEIRRRLHPFRFRWRRRRPAAPERRRGDPLVPRPADPEPNLHETVGFRPRRPCDRRQPARGPVDTPTPGGGTSEDSPLAFTTIIPLGACRSNTAPEPW